MCICFVHWSPSDADDHVWPQRQLEQLLSRAGAEDSLHGAEAGRVDSLLPADLRAAIWGPTSQKPWDQVNSTYNSSLWRCRCCCTDLLITHRRQDVVAEPKWNVPTLVESRRFFHCISFFCRWHGCKHFFSPYMSVSAAFPSAAPAGPGCPELLENCFGKHLIHWLSAAHAAQWLIL